MTNQTLINRVEEFLCLEIARNVIYREQYRLKHDLDNYAKMTLQIKKDEREFERIEDIRREES